MRRRKLTRILLTEGDCNVSIKNSQNETPLDIAIRKSYVEIFEILNSQERLRQQRKQRSSKTEKKSTSREGSHELAGAVNWSPYGCHYFPDPSAFPKPKLETLPKEPLQQGEQYYCDLNGCIRKGPIGVGSTCYCAPFFRHIEHKLNSNRRSLRKYVGHEVKALEERTNQQIEQLTRDMLCDRVRCDGVEEDGEEKEEGAYGGEAVRKYSLSRCQSLDALSEHKSNTFMQLSNLRSNNAQSCTLLDDLPASSRTNYLNSPMDKQSMHGEVSSDEEAVDENIVNENVARQQTLINANENEHKHVEESKAKANEIQEIQTAEDRIEIKKSVQQLVREQEKLLSTNLLYNNCTNLRKAEACEEQVYNTREQQLQQKEQQPHEKSMSWRGNEVLPKANMFTVKAEIVQNGYCDVDEYDNDDNEAQKVDEEVKETPFVVPRAERLGTPSYAQLKKTLPAKSKMTQLSNSMEKVQLTPTPILSAMCAATLEALSDSNSDESEENVDYHEHDQHKRELDYFLNMRRTVPQTKITDNSTTDHRRTLAADKVELKPNDLKHVIHNNDYRDCVVPKNAYFHPLPKKLDYQHNNYSENNHYMPMSPNTNNRPPNILHYTNLAQDTRLARRRPFLGQHFESHGNNYLSPVNSNSGSSIASSTDYGRALRHAAILRQPMPGYMRPVSRPLLHATPHHQTNLSNDSGLGSHNYVEHSKISNHLNSNNNHNHNHYVLNALEPATSQFIYSANTVALALGNGPDKDATEDSTVYPLVSSLV